MIDCPVVGYATRWTFKRAPEIAALDTKGMTQSADAAWSTSKYYYCCSIVAQLPLKSLHGRSG